MPYLGKPYPLCQQFVAAIRHNLISDAATTNIPNPVTITERYFVSSPPLILPIQNLGDDRWEENNPED